MSKSTNNDSSQICNALYLKGNIKIVICQCVSPIINTFMDYITMFIRTLIYLFILFSLLSGCGKPLVVKVDEPVPATEPVIVDPAETAKQLEKQGHYQQAAEEYLRVAAQTTPPTKQGHQLSAIRAFLKGNQLAKAKAELAKLDVKQSYGIEIPLELVRAKIDLAEKHVKQAERRLNGINSATLPEPLQLEYKQLHAQVLFVKGEVLNAVHEWIALDNLSKSEPSVLKDNHQHLWKGLSTLSPNKLKKVKQEQGDIFSGWVALALLTKTSHKAYLQQGINHWQLRFPIHPATTNIIPSLVQNVDKTLATPTRVTLLLPSFDSKFGKYAQALENGVFTAAAQNNNRIKVTARYVNEDNVLAIYKSAVKEGTDFVIGPLMKSTIAALADSQSQLPVPTLALNHLGKPINTGNLYQFGLLPEDEAKELAIRAWADGHRVALVLVPEGEWGKRVSKAFEKVWKKQGGKITATHVYGSDFEFSILQVLRKKNVKTANMVFMGAFPITAPTIRKMFVSILNDRLPIYSTSHIYGGAPNARVDKKLNGVMFVDMPWVLAPNENAKKLQTILQESWSRDDISKFKRLYALGIDSYALLSQLQQLTRSPWQGQTGLLSVDNRGVIHRNKLLWARFVEGKPQLID